VSKRIGVLVVAYNAISTLAQTLDRIPPGVMDALAGVLVFDDHSSDNTYEAALEYKRAKGLDKLSVFHNERNLRYGGNQKRGFRYAIEHGYDVIVLLHGDGQYAPEVMRQLVDPVERGDADLVMGSRMMPGCRPLHGGMPLYKFAGNRILTFCENALLGTRLAEFHSGYRAYNCHALAALPLERCSNEWHFDTEIIIQLLAGGYRIAETPIPTYYGDEICRVNGMAYAYRCLESVARYRLHQSGLVRTEAFDVGK
jgi:glycosyltransferase involved in cell wall biosynthesis